MDALLPSPQGGRRMTQHTLVIRLSRNSKDVLEFLALVTAYFFRRLDALL